MQTFFLAPDYLNQLLQRSDYSTIKSLCKSNKNINHYCKNNQNAKKIISERKQKFLANKLNYFFANLDYYIKGLSHTNKLLYNKINDLNRKITAFILASSIGDYDIVNELINQGSDPSILDNLALTVASENGHYKVVDRLLKDSRVNPNRHGEGLSPFQLAIENGYTDLVFRFLQDNRINPNAHNNYAIRAASLNGYLDIVNLLLENKFVNPSADDNFALRFASLKGNWNVVNRLLQDPRVDPSVNDNQVIKLAMNAGHMDIVRRLLQDPRVRNKLTKHQIDTYSHE